MFACMGHAKGRGRGMAKNYGWGFIGHLTLRMMESGYCTRGHNHLKLAYVFDTQANRACVVLNLGVSTKPGVRASPKVYP